jgi:hypothetical protein
MGQITEYWLIVMLAPAQCRDGTTAALVIVLLLPDEE